MKVENLKYYSQTGAITSLEKFRSFIDWLPADSASIGQVVQGLIVHDLWFEQYGETYKEENEYV